MENIFAVTLIILAIVLFAAVRRGWVGSGTLQTMANVAGTVALIGAVAAFIIPTVNTGGNPSIRVVNELELPIEINIEGESRGRINSHNAKTFLVDSFPAYVEWVAVRLQTSNDKNLGERLAGNWNGVDNNSTIYIDHTIGDQSYYFPKVVNQTEDSCSVIVDKGLTARIDQNLYVGPHTVTNLGYYKLHINSNVYFYCADRFPPSYWVANRERVFIGNRLSSRVESPSGILHLTISD